MLDFAAEDDMSTTTTEPLLTYDDFVRLHGDEKLVELVNGRVVRYPMPHSEHGYVNSNVVLIVGGFVKANGLGRGFTGDTFIRTKIEPPGCRGVDFCFVSYAKITKTSPVPQGPLEIAPELVIEVRSHTDQTGAVNEKVDEYLAAGVTVVVVIDPGTESLAVHRKDELPIRMHNSDELTLPDVLPGFAVEVKKFFQ
jgi:Uma2 family endonuclease